MKNIGFCGKWYGEYGIIKYNILMLGGDCMGVSLEEQEVVIQANRDESFATAYVTDRTWMTKLDKRVEANPELFQVVEEHKIAGEVIGKTYRFPKKMITIRSGEVQRREMTEEERKQQAVRLQDGLRKWKERQGEGSVKE